MGCHALLQGILLTQESNPCLLCLLHCRQILYPLSHLGSPHVVEVKSSEVKSLSRVRLFVTPWTAAYQAPQSIEFFRQEYWSGLSFPSGDLPHPGTEPGSPTLRADSLPTEPPGNKSLNRVHSKWTALETSQNLPPPLSVKKLSSKKTPEVKEGTSSVLNCPRLLA